jgi:hypothetical protein
MALKVDRTLLVFDRSRLEWYPAQRAACAGGFAKTLALTSYPSFSGTLEEGGYVPDLYRLSRLSRNTARLKGRFSLP